MVSESQMNEFTAWAKRRGVIFPSSEIYGGLGSSYDYGPVGVEMKNRLKTSWWRSMVHERQDVVGLDSAIILNPAVWQASGHLDNFSDLMVEDLKTHKRYRVEDLDDPTKSPEGNPVGEAKQFNVMFKTFVGPVEDDASTAYLRPETCQGIFIDFKQILETSRQRVPFGIAQIGKSFRNEITPGNLTFRTREFEQMEMEFFVREEEANKWFDYWVEARFQWYLDLGIRKENLRLFKHPKAKLAHYSKGTTDIEYKFPWGWGELEGIANRGNFDLVQHQKNSGKDLSVFDEETREKFVPWVIEPAGGVDRALLAILLDAWKFFQKGRKEDGEPETVLEVAPTLAAYDAAVLPLVKKPELLKMSQKLVASLRAAGKHVFYDESGSIGRRYRRMDEIGTPICYTVDFESLDDKKVTARDRDSMKQTRVTL
ncbi:glycine--tRNA ligase [Candidatus Berkelbacteria bacterium RIFCSPLOWO2_01_FULL_50_28]|uniref:Glycine--tRNA ligase n=1 Tax=Candidatus Berkelbacteria bacterium RIFCSPLOWO2_01_FULL_50_28 TaxID=1797471 RepID=A0A1F5EBF1_9BACT|nr:MAG: glycine--tRNA ligase [Candidatus Berkelbacteria bacterium RIFCSPHIGHO2_12_FULL_50_11]OGD64739.1 MAG: glycine--tRNA ligase [Candidatus Berkelbacteria bacterium RIFCSPLOWO2_01_FULL_50_28]